MKVFSVASHYKVCLQELGEDELSVGEEWDKTHESLLCC